MGCLSLLEAILTKKEGEGPLGFLVMEQASRLHYKRLLSFSRQVTAGSVR
jgi:hypothetical protein